MLPFKAIDLGGGGVGMLGRDYDEIRSTNQTAETNS